VADRLGLLVWAELPVYWNVEFANENTLERGDACSARHCSRVGKHWVLKDFRAPLRLYQGVQDYWNHKGLVSEFGE